MSKSAEKKAIKLQERLKSIINADNDRIAEVLHFCADYPQIRDGWFVAATIADKNKNLYSLFYFCYCGLMISREKQPFTLIKECWDGTFEAMFAAALEAMGKQDWGKWALFTASDAKEKGKDDEYLQSIVDKYLGVYVAQERENPTNSGNSKFNEMMAKQAEQNKKLSHTLDIIVPIHNESKEVYQPLIDSILRQKYDREKYTVNVIYVIDKRNPDLPNVELPLFREGKIITYIGDAIYQKFYQWRVNFGTPSLTRNFGLEKATSEYIWWIDADDELKGTDAIQSVLENVGNDDLYQFEVEGDDGFLYKNASKWIFNKIYRREFLIEKNLKIPDLPYEEDTSFLIITRAYCPQPRILDKSLIIKHDNVDSITKSNKDINYAEQARLIAYKIGIAELQKRNDLEKREQIINETICECIADVYVGAKVNKNIYRHDYNPIVPKAALSKWLREINFDVKKNIGIIYDPMVKVKMQTCQLPLYKKELTQWLNTL